MIDLHLLPRADDINHPTMALCLAVEVAHRIDDYAKLNSDDSLRALALLLKAHLRAARVFAS